MLVPVAAACWEAWISSAIMIGRSKSIRMLVAARPGYVNPVLLAKMVATFDQLSGGRLAVNLIAGQSDVEAAAEGITLAKEQRYELMDEEVEIMKALWTSRGPVDFDGRFHTLRGRADRAAAAAAALSALLPRRRLGRRPGRLSAKHSDVHLFWGDTCERIADNMRDDPGAGGAAWPGGQDRLRHAAADHLPRDRGRGVGRGATSWCAT